jgi:hypothetical protein
MNKSNLNINFTIYLIISSILFSQKSTLEGTVGDSLNGNKLIGAKYLLSELASVRQRMMMVLTGLTTLTQEFIK